MSTFEYIPGVTTPSSYSNEPIIKVMNGGSAQIPANAFYSGGTALITSGSVSLTFESNSSILHLLTPKHLLVVMDLQMLLYLLV